MKSENLTNHFDGVQVYLKREDLKHSGARKINNVIGKGSALLDAYNTGGQEAGISLIKKLFE